MPTSALAKPLTFLCGQDDEVQIRWVDDEEPSEKPERKDPEIFTSGTMCIWRRVISSVSWGCR